MSKFSVHGTSPIKHLNWNKKNYDGFDVRSYFEFAELDIELELDINQPSLNKITEEEKLLDEILEAKKSFEDGNIANFEEVFGQNQPGI